MFKAFGACGNGLSDGRWGVRMYGDVGTPVFCSLNRSMNLRYGELYRFNRIVR